MKRIPVILLLAIVLFSCKKSELDYSCDPVINDFVVKNEQALSQISLQELTAYSLPLQKAIFNSWNEQKKRSSWVAKLQYVLNHISFSKEEQFHVKALISHINQDYFKEENIEKDSESRHQFAAKWMKYAAVELKWPNKFTAFIVYRLYTDQGQLGAEISALKTAGSSINTDAEATNCNCNASADFCGGANCNSGDCTTTSGCGWLWSMPCNGSCY